MSNPTSKIEKEIEKIYEDTFDFSFEQARKSWGKTRADYFIKKITDLVSASHKELIERVRKEVIGSDIADEDRQDLGWLTKEHRDNLRAEQRNLLSTIEKDL